MYQCGKGAAWLLQSQSQSQVVLVRAMQLAMLGNSAATAVVSDAVHAKILVAAERRAKKAVGPAISVIARRTKHNQREFRFTKIRSLACALLHCSAEQ